MDSKVNNIVDKIRTENIKEFYFNQSMEDGYYLKLDNDSIYLTSEEAESLLKQLHIKTDSIILKKFKVDHEKELEAKKIIYYIYELGIIYSDFSSVNATKEELINATIHLGRITKDYSLAEIDFKTIQKEDLYNILSRKHNFYLKKYEDFLLTEVNSGSFSSWDY